MALIDNLLVLDPGTGETLTETRHGPNAIDLLNAQIDYGAGEDIYAQFICLGATSGATASATVELQVVASYLPILTPTTGTGTHTLASPAVWTTTAHGWATGTPVTIALNGGTIDANFTAGKTYYVIKKSANTYNLASTLANALAGTGINASAASTGSPQVTSAPCGTVASITAATSDVITLTGHGLQTGTPVQIYIGGATLTGVTALLTYYVRRLSADTFNLSTTFSGCFDSSTAVDITAVTDTNGELAVYAPVRVVGTSGPLFRDTVQAGSIIPVCFNQVAEGPVFGSVASGIGSMAIPSGRHLQTRYVASTTFTGGKYRCDIVLRPQDGRKFYPSAITVV